MKILCAPKITLITVLLFLCFIQASRSQNCGCTISEVQSNTVSPCNYTVGTIVNVNSVSSFLDAIANANANGGNMTILIADGTYQIASTSSYPYITADNVVFRSQSGNRDAVIIRGGGMMDVDPNTENGLGIAGNNIVIADLTIRDVGNHGIQVSGHNLYVHNVRIQDTYQQMLKGATVDETIEGATVQCSLFEYTAGVGPNWYIGGLDIHKGHDWLVRDNVFRNIISPGDAVAEHAIHFWNHSADNIIERNQIINCDRGIGFGLGGSPNTGGMIRNNMISNDGSGLFNDVGISLETSPGTQVYNNSIFIQYQNAIEYRFTATTGVDIVNNVTNKLIRSRDGGEATLATNVTTAEDSWFVDVETGDLHLAYNVSELVNAGTDLSDEVADDFDQNMRPHGSAYDIGAHELFSTAAEDPGMIGFQVYPNPASDKIIVMSQDHGPFRISVYNNTGQLISEKTSFVSFVELDLEKNPRGLYTVCLRSEKSIVSKVIMLN